MMNEEAVKATIAKSPLLSDLDPTALGFLVRLGRRRTFQRGEVLMRQGEPSTSIYFLLKGKVRAERSRRTDDQPIRLADLEAGAVVGEMGVVIDIPRSATVTALEPTDALELDGPNFDRLAKAYPILHRVIARLLSERLRATESRVGQSLPS
ncbi:MAG: cyclic nucleotide-binding domain-containing protein [Chloroflexota bacterium]|nr:cyclic nucleotide-binding domain-containing protein [Chloroflexota bacterium]